MSESQTAARPFNNSSRSNPIASTEYNGVTVCHGRGDRCFVKPGTDFFLAPRPESEAYDQSLTELVGKLNALIADATARIQRMGVNLRFSALINR
jgi:hypothetical protein